MQLNVAMIDVRLRRRRRNQASFRALEKMCEWRRQQRGLLGLVVPFAELDRVSGAVLRNKCVAGIRIKDTALQLETTLGVNRERDPIVGIHMAKVTLGVDMKLDGIQYALWEETTKKRQREILVNIIYAAQGRCLPFVVEQVPQIMQQAGRAHLGARPGWFGKRRRL